MAHVRLIATLVLLTLVSASERGRGKGNEPKKTDLILNPELLPRQQRGPGRPRKNSVAPKVAITPLKMAGPLRAGDQWLESIDGHPVCEDDLTVEDRRLYSLFPPGD